MSTNIIVPTGKMIGKRIWTPREIASKAWYDAADTSTITESGGSVSQWDDKSGNGHHVTQGTGSQQPTTGTRTIGANNALDFNGSSHRLTIGSGPYFKNINKGLIIAVIDIDTLAVPNTILGMGKFATTLTRARLDMPGVYRCAGRRLDGDNFQTTSFGSASAGLHILGGLFDYANAQTNITIDGTLDTPKAFQTAGFTSNTDSNGFVIGARADESGFLNGGMGELLIVEGDLSTATRQRIEGYLAHKWGLTANLPGGHPYKTSSPLV